MHRAYDDTSINDSATALQTISVSIEFVYSNMPWNFIDGGIETTNNICCTGWSFFSTNRRANTGQWRPNT